MVVSKQTNICRFCSKVFCCSDCRDVHENNKHSKPKCLLCIKADLPFNPCQDEEAQKKSELLCHLVFNHMPLYCKLCGKKYKTYQDFLNTKPCSWWEKERARKQLHTPKLNIAYAPSLIQKNQKNREQNDIFVNNVSPLTTQFLSADKKLLINTINNSAISHLKQDKFDSPPDLVRHTSTPVHSLMTSGQKQTNTAFIPQFTLKTPSSRDKKSFETTGSTTGSTTESTAGSTGGTVSSPSEFESQYFTGQSTCFGQSIGKLSNFSISNNQDSTRENQCWHSPTFSNEDKPYESMSEKITEESKEKSITGTGTLERISRINESTEKRVRFSDQCKVLDSTKAMDKVEELQSDNSAHFADKEVFFQACENLEDSKKNSNGSRRDINQDEICSSNPRNGSIMTEKNTLTSSATRCESNSNAEKIKERKVADSNIGENKESSSSRILMMLLVEKTDSKDFSSLNLGSLIDSGLKKLEKTVASCSSRSHGQDSDSSKTFSVDVTEAHELKKSVKGNNSAGKSCGSPSENTSIKDCFFEYYCESGSKTPLKESQEIKEKQELIDKANTSLDSYKSDGFFSVVARVVRSALKKLPVVGTMASRNLSREPVPRHVCSPVIAGTKITSTSSLSYSTTDVVTIGSTRTSAASQILFKRSTSKRPRERLDSSEELPQVPTRNSPGSSPGSRCEVVFSPAAKRHRGWYRIKAREPIARMRERQLISPRGASLETQRFQQGTLTIGDTMLPLPSRAHQSTQTED